VVYLRIVLVVTGGYGSFAYMDHSLIKHVIDIIYHWTPALLFTNRSLKKHEGLTKAQSSLLTQVRTGDIGLRDYLFRCKVPEVPTPYCSCGEGRETVEHLVSLVL
jgi:hypothetical protein